MVIFMWTRAIKGRKCDIIGEDKQSDMSDGCLFFIRDKCLYCMPRTDATTSFFSPMIRVYRYMDIYTWSQAYKEVWRGLRGRT